MTDDKSFIAAQITSPTASSGPPVLLIHGFVSSGAGAWPGGRWADPIAAQGRKAIVVDLPGHGASRRVSASSDGATGRIVQALADLADREGAPVDIIGYSLGARIGWALAAKHPDLVNRAVLGGLSPGDPFKSLDYAAARALADTGTQPGDPLTAMIAGMVVSSGQDAHSLINLMDGLGSEPFEPAQEAPACPVLLVAGTDDQIAGGIGALEAHLRGAVTERVPGDHFTTLSSDAFRRTAFRFLGLDP